MQLLEEILEKTDGKICMHCIGRMLSKTVEGVDNVSRAQSLGIELNDGECIICGNVFDKINDELFDKIYDKLDFLKVEFDSFVVGSRIDKEMKKRDEEFIRELNLDVEPIKKEINRIIGKRLEQEMQKEVNFEKQDIIVNVNLIKEPKVRVQINPIFIEGKYNKLIRGIPQTKWPCRKCRGRGCEECNFTGKQYPCSVEELLSEHILKATDGYEAKFHGAGREDIDVLMLGSGRPFVLEIKEPKIRKIDLATLEKEINEINQGKTQYHNLKFTHRNRKAEIKVSSPDAYKIYKALVECEQPYDKDKLDRLSELGEIHQQTPIRVSHRRADKVRIKHVLDLSCEVIDDTHFEMTIKTEGGLYIKELISGDEGRSQPNVADKLGVKAFCKQLDVIEVSDK